MGTLWNERRMLSAQGIVAVMVADNRNRADRGDTGARGSIQ